MPRPFQTCHAATLRASAADGAIASRARMILGARRRAAHATPFRRHFAYYACPRRLPPQRISFTRDSFSEPAGMPFRGAIAAMPRDGAARHDGREELGER